MVKQLRRSKASSESRWPTEAGASRGVLDTDVVFYARIGIIDHDGQRTSKAADLDWQDQKGSKNIPRGCAGRLWICAASGPDGKQASRGEAVEGVWRRRGLGNC